MLCHTCQYNVASATLGKVKPSVLFGYTSLENNPYAVANLPFFKKEPKKCSSVKTHEARNVLGTEIDKAAGN